MAYPCSPCGVASSRARRPRRPGGFTLIELLTVIAIIGILAAILIPVVGRVRQSARQAQALSNLRQIAVSAQMWSGENRNRIVPVYTPSEGNAASLRNWTGQLAPYLGRKSADPFAGAADLPVCASVLEPERFGYGYNYSYLSYPHRTAKPWVTMNEVAAPARTVLLTSNRNGNDASGSFLSWRAYVRPPGNSFSDYVVDFAFSGKATVLWLDGHVSTETEAVLMADQSLWDLL